MPFICYCLCIVFFFLDPAFAGQKEKRAGEKWGLKGSFRTVFEYEEDEIAGEDSDLKSYLRLEVDPFKNDRISFYFYGRTRLDLDSESETDHVFGSSDTRIFQAYLEVKDLPDSFSIRGGRQWVHEVEGVYFDGILIGASPFSKFDILIFGGRPVSEYSSTDAQSIYGGSITCHPLKHTVFSADAVRSDEDNPIVNDHVSLHLKQRIGNHTRLIFDQKFLNRRSRDFRFGGNAYIKPAGLELRWNFYKILNRYAIRRKDDIEARYYSGYYLLLDETEEIERFDISATKYFGNRFSCSVGFSFTNIIGKENPTNRDSRHGFISIQVYDLLIQRLTISLDANWAAADVSGSWTEVFVDVDKSITTTTVRTRQKDETFFISGEFEYFFLKGLSVSLGMTYGDFDFERAINTNQSVSDLVPASLLVTNVGEKFITRTFFAEASWKINRTWSLRLLAEHNRSKINTATDTDDYMRIVTSLRCRF